MLQTPPKTTCGVHAFTYVEVSDPWIVLSEPLEPAREALHEAAAPVVARRIAQSRAEKTRESQDAQEHGARSHAAG